MTSPTRRYSQRYSGISAISVRCSSSRTSRVDSVCCAKTHPQHLSSDCMTVESVTSLLIESHTRLFSLLSMYDQIPHDSTAASRGLLWLLHAIAPGIRQLPYSYTLIHSSTLLPPLFPSFLPLPPAPHLASGAWTLLYDSNTHGLSVNSLQTQIFRYKGGLLLCVCCASCRVRFR